MNKTYTVGDIEAGHHVISLISEDVANHFEFPSFITPVSGMLREVLENGTTKIYKIYLNGLGTTKFESGVVSMMLKTGMELAQDYTVSNYRPPIP